MEKRKRNISVRLSESDIKRTKDASQRLGVKESDLFRFGVKVMLRKLTPLSNVDLRGVDLIPAWLEWGEELAEYFDLDVKQLDILFNKDVAEDKRVDSADLDLMMLSRLSASYIVNRLSEWRGRKVDVSQARQELKNYLYEKYVLTNSFDNKSNAGEFMEPVSSSLPVPHPEYPRAYRI